MGLCILIHCRTPDVLGKWSLALPLGLLFAWMLQMWNRIWTDLCILGISSTTSLGFHLRSTFQSSLLTTFFAKTHLGCVSETLIGALKIPESNTFSKYTYMYRSYVNEDIPWSRFICKIWAMLSTLMCEPFVEIYSMYFWSSLYSYLTSMEH